MKEIPRLLAADLFSWSQSSVYQGTQTEMGGMDEKGLSRDEEKSSRE